MDGMVRSAVRLNGPGDLRRRWSAARKAAIVAESFVAGAKVAEVAARHGVQASQLSTWRRQAIAQESAGGAQSASRAAEPSLATIGFVPVSVCAEDKQPTDAVSGSERTVGVIEITLGDARIRVTSGVDGATLSRVLAAVRRGGR